MTHDEMIAVIQAHKDGKMIQRSLNNSLDPWSDCSSDPDWDFSSLDYRIKPEPMEIWVNVYHDLLPGFHPSESAARAALCSGGRTVKFREVLDE